MVIQMPCPKSRFRLQSSAFERTDDSHKVDPKRVVFLSVEGDETERTYFRHLNAHLDNSIIKIEVLRHRRGDGYSDPQYVIELLEEYISLRDGDVIPDDIQKALSDKYSKPVLTQYLSGDVSLPKNKKDEIQSDLMLAGIDYDYRRYLRELQDKPGNSDIFAVILDRDAGNHSKELLEACETSCKEKGYLYCLSNPCFEFWLLLHLCDPQDEYSPEQLKDFLENKKVSKRHTALSAVISSKTNQYKTIGLRAFEEHYFPNISKAMTRSKSYATTFPDLYDNLGSNIPDLLRMLESK